MTCAAEIEAAIRQLVDATAAQLPNGCTGTGEPCRRRRKVIADQVVEIRVIGHGGERVDVEIPYITGTASHTVRQAAEMLAR